MSCKVSQKLDRINLEEDLQASVDNEPGRRLGQKVVFKKRFIEIPLNAINA